jgi:cytochrome subunit of sulfide dehydrogenase
MRIPAIGIAVVLAAVYAATAQAQATNPNYARDIAATCTACHGTDGRSVGGIPPSLAGQDRNYLLQALKDFKAGNRPGTTIMHQHAKGYTDEQLELIATYFSNVKAAPAATPASRPGY